MSLYRTDPSIRSLEEFYASLNNNLDDDEWEDEDFDELDESDGSGEIVYDPDYLPLTDDPYTKYLTAEELSAVATHYSSKIFHNYKFLHNILLQHESKIAKRWAGKSRQQRLAILLSAWPGMVTSHRPDFETVRRLGNCLGEAPLGNDKESFMWPYINQEDLLQPAILPLMLHSRGHNLPEAFAGADYEATNIGRVSRNTKPVFLNGYVMVLHGAKDADEYGKLYAWEDHEGAFECMRTRQQYLPGEGLLVLQLQERVMEFLVKCCKLILHDIAEEDLEPADTTEASETLEDAERSEKVETSTRPEPFIKKSPAGGFDTLTAMMAEAPYRVPAQLDMDRIISLLEARALAAEDHLWSLREDPAYFSDCQAERKEHRQEMIPDERGNEHHVFQPHRIDMFFGRVSCYMVIEAYETLQTFRALTVEARNLRDLLAKHKDSIASSGATIKSRTVIKSLPTIKPLPEELMTALVRFRCYLEEAAARPINDLAVFAPASPPFRSHWVRLVPIDITSTVMGIRHKEGVKKSKIEKQLTWLLGTISRDEQKLFLASMPKVLDELERLLASSAEARSLVTARIAEIIGDISIVSVCLGQLELFQPWARGFDRAHEAKEEEIEEQYYKLFREASDWTRKQLAQNPTLKVTGMLSNPGEKRFYYPSEKRRTRETTETMITAEENLDEFWAEIDRITYKNGRFGKTFVGQFLAQPGRTLRRTKMPMGWVDEPADDRKGKGKNKKNEALDPELAMLYRPMSTIYIGEEPPADDGGQSTREKQKVKKRGQNGINTELPFPPEAPAPAPEPILASQPSEPETITVDARSLKVFRVLFYNPEVTSSPGEVPWTDFLHALTSAGQFAAEKLYGSVWQFSRLAGNDQSRIQFHEPHPNKKLPFTVARRYGRRLTRNYGWDGSTFVLKEK